MEQTCGLFKKEVKKRLVAITLLKNIVSFKTKKMILLEDCFKVFYLIAFLYLEAVTMGVLKNFKSFRTVQSEWY